MIKGAMATAVLRSGHVFATFHMPTPEYQRGHGTRATELPELRSTLFRPTS